jgi:3-methylcrotonyl-CoA carboxylase alpha subunit
MDKSFTINGQDIKVQDFKKDGNNVSFSLNGKTYNYNLVSKDGFEMVLDNGQRFKAALGSTSRDGDAMVISGGREAIMTMGTTKKMKKGAGHAGGLASPMPGKIFKIVKESGSEVKKGEPILILEAMKMEHSIRSDKDGRVKKIFYKVGELVQGGVILAEVE